MARIQHLSPKDAAKLIADYLRLTNPDTANEAIGYINEIISNYQPVELADHKPYPVSIDVDCGECTMQMSFSCMSTDTFKYMAHAIAHEHAPEPIHFG